MDEGRWQTITWALVSRILILDCGSQFTQLIARRVREAHVYCEIHPPTRSLAWIREWKPTGIILSGGNVDREMFAEVLRHDGTDAGAAA